MRYRALLKEDSRIKRINVWKDAISEDPSFTIVIPSNKGSEDNSKNSGELPQKIKSLLSKIASGHSKNPGTEIAKSYKIPKYPRYNYDKDNRFKHGDHVEVHIPIGDLYAGKKYKSVVMTTLSSTAVKIYIPKLNITYYATNSQLRRIEQ